MALFLGAGDHGPVDLEARDLRTHGVVVGMTGSGKTGLCLVLLEEMARAGVPVIAIDPKGDLGNLALVFPELNARQFNHWAPDPEQTATQWREGLARWDLGTPQMADLKSRLNVRIYTPGSTAGEPIDVMSSLAAPGVEGEALRALVADTVSAVLGLVGRQADPVRDPAHVVLSHLLEGAWVQGESLDLETLVLRLVDPPFSKVGVFPLDRFFPPDDRMKLAMELNSVLASPSFSSWRVGAALDAARLLEGGTHIFSLSHLSEPERHFFVALLLARLQAWSRAQPGTEDLRGLLFFDECAGYLPPDPKRPASKGPLITLMKQARAVGLGVVLATQNPIDLDYRALSNSGHWFIGRLRTEQDRKRLLKGLDPGLDGVVQELGKRQFAMVRAKGGHQVFGTRHAMCYLRGPMTRADLGQLTPDSPTVPEPIEAPVVDDASGERPPVPVEQWVLDPRVAFSARMKEHFSRHASAARPDGTQLLEPALVAEFDLHFHKDNVGFSERVREVRVFYPLGAALDEPTALPIEASDLLDRLDGSVYGPLPEWMDEQKELNALKKQLSDSVYRTESRGLYSNPKLKLTARSDESREDFDARCADAVEDRVDAAVAKLKARYEKAVDRLQDRVRGKQRKQQDYQSQLSRRKAEEVVNAGELVLALFTSRRKSLSTAMTKRGRVSDTKERIGRMQDEIEDLREDAVELREKLEGDMEVIEDREAQLLDATIEREVRLRRADVVIARFGVLWVPASRRI